MKSLIDEPPSVLNGAVLLSSPFGETRKSINIQLYWYVAQNENCHRVDIPIAAADPYRQNPSAKCALAIF
jgi:hypothetical protein